MPSGHWRTAEFNELLNQVKLDRCEASFRALFDHFYPRILSYFQQGGIKEQKSSDLAQETMLAVWHKAALFNSSKGSCTTWIFTIARNLRFDHFRSSARDVLSTGAEDLFEQLEASGYRLEDQIFSADIRAQINSLSAEQKDVVEAMYFDGYSHGEYAELRKIPLGTVKSRVRLALAHLKKEMGEL